MGFESLQARRPDSPNDLRKQVRQGRLPGFERDAAGGPVPPFKALRQGYVVGVSNPKAFMLVGALLPQFVVPDAGHVPLQLLLLGLVAVVIGLLSDSLWAVVASRVRDWFTATPRRGEAIGVAGGVSMIGLGVTLAVSGRE